MDYYTKRKAKVNIAKELREKGWKLFGWKENTSDSNSDYYNPEDWSGIAEKNGYVIAICKRDILESGHEEYKYIPTQGPVCDFCGGTGVYPGGLTYEEAKKNPLEQHFNKYCESKSGYSKNGVKITSFSGLPNVVSPLHYHENGDPKCFKCHGSKFLSGKPRKELVCVWPKFQANPPRKLWHIEKDGIILASGIGLSKCIHDNEHMEPYKSQVENAVKILVNKMESEVVIKEPKKSLRLVEFGV